MKVITPYVIFDGNCREAMTFYHEILGGKLDVMRASDAPNMPPGMGDRLIHARLVHGDTVLMASDNMPGMPYSQSNSIWLNVACETDEEVDSLYARLSDGGHVGQAPHDTFWNARFAMFTDRFGVNWMLNHERAAFGS